MNSSNREPAAEAVLGEVNDTQRLNKEEQEDDYALAKMSGLDDEELARRLQEQERAFLMFRRMAENHPPAYQGASGSGAAAAAAPATGAAADSHGPGEALEVEGMAAPAEEEEELDDEELARRLQEEEDAEHYRHMLAMAGMLPGEDDEEQEFDDDPVDPDTMTYEELTALGEAVGTVSKGITEAQIAALPLQRYSEVAGATAACADEQCAVCRLEFSGVDEVRVLPCKHYYHPECASRWLVINKACPVCSKEVVPGRQP